MRRVCRTNWIVAVLLTTVVWLDGCDTRRDTLRIYLPITDQLYDFDALAEVLRDETGIRLVRYRPTSGKPHSLDLLADRVIDLAVVENSALFKPHINVVLPLYRSVLHVLYRKDLVVTSAQDIFSKHSIYIDADSKVALEFVDFMTRRMGVVPDSLNMVDRFEPGLTDVMLVFSPLLPATLEPGMDGYRLLSFDDVENLGKGSRVEAIPYLVPQLRPFVIPANTYPQFGNEKPVVTLAVDMLLVTHDAVPRATIYRLAKGLMYRRAEFSQYLPELFNSMTERFDPELLKFPLHPGAQDYIDRHAPSFLERYADLISLLTYLSVALVSGMIALIKWTERRKKERIDLFYVRVLEIRNQIRAHDSVAASDYQDRLDTIETEAFALLIDERLAANESFRIFITLLRETTALLATRSSTPVQQNQSTSG